MASSSWQPLAGNLLSPLASGVASKIFAQKYVKLKKCGAPQLQIIGFLEHSGLLLLSLDRISRQLDLNLHSIIDRMQLDRTNLISSNSHESRLTLFCAGRTSSDKFARGPGIVCHSRQE